MLVYKKTIMDLLAKCSTVLYDREVIKLSAKVKKLEAENKMLKEKLLHEDTYVELKFDGDIRKWLELEKKCFTNLRDKIYTLIDDSRFIFDLKCNAIDECSEKINKLFYDEIKELVVVDDLFNDDLCKMKLGEIINSMISLLLSLFKYDPNERLSVLYISRMCYTFVKWHLKDRKNDYSFLMNAPQTECLECLEAYFYMIEDYDNEGYCSGLCRNYAMGNIY